MPGESVLVHGPPGVGKSRLCLEFATEYKTHHRIVHLDCVGFDTLEAIADELARTLHVTLLPDHGIAQLGASLDARRVGLLVLDGVDRLPDELATWCAQLLLAHPTLCVLATAQAERHGIDHMLMLKPLPSEQADSPGVAMLRQLLSDTRRRTLSTAQLVQIASRLDGLPLAIELCAHHLEVMSPDALITQLDARLLLQDNSKNPLRSSLELGWAQLDEDSRHTLMAASLCQATFDIHVLAAITQRPITALTASVLTLRRHALLSSSPYDPLRYTLLESVRDLARHHHLATAHHATHLSAWLAHLNKMGSTHAPLAHFHDSVESTKLLIDHHEDFLSASQDTSTASPGILNALLCVTLHTGGSSNVDRWKPTITHILTMPHRDAVRDSAMSVFLFATLRMTYADVHLVLDELRDAHARLCAHHGEVAWTHFLQAEILYRHHVMEPDDALITEMMSLVKALTGLDDQLALWASYHHVLMLIPDQGVTMTQELTAISVRFEKFGMMRLSTSALAQCAIASLRSNQISQAVEHLDHAIIKARVHGLDSLHSRALSLRAMVSKGRQPNAQRAADMATALELICQRGDYTNEAHIRAQMTSLHAEIGDYSESYHHATRALMIYRAVRHSYMPRQLELVLMQCAWLMHDDAEFARRLVEFQPDVTHDDIHLKMERTELLIAINMLSPTEDLRTQSLRQIDEALTSDTLSAWWRALFALLRSLDSGSEGLDQALAFGTHFTTHNFTVEDRLLVRMIWDKLTPQLQRIILETIAPNETALYVRRDGMGHITEFAAPGEPGESLSWTTLVRRPVMRDMCQSLITHHARTPGEPMSSLMLAEQVWPDEMTTPEALSNRLYNVMAQLKRLGFGHLVASSRDGYWIHTHITVHHISQLDCPA